MPSSFLTAAVPVEDGGEEEDPEEIQANSTASDSPPRRNLRTPPRRNARMSVGGRGRPSEPMASRHAGSASMSSGLQDFVVITGSEQPAPPAPSAHSPNRGRLLQRYAHLAGTPPHRPGREAGAWVTTARWALLPNGIGHELSSDEETPTGR
ncbi:hypothetical protein PR202_ga04682 [Eleusine coracana subsp. coracana]|uniref:Uncharacterized protein n=1 Tax=Eleusine coracana subsp. coracana TaxID=191504 RepID=A0AAV5BQI8_ELECO|nr:hypothetical protein PR202_ga04682 [Eleusine coracana subsp. coracana]